MREKQPSQKLNSQQQRVKGNKSEPANQANETREQIMTQ